MRNILAGIGSTGHLISLQLAALAALVLGHASPAQALTINIGCTAYAYLGTSKTVMQLAEQYPSSHPGFDLVTRDEEGPGQFTDCASSPTTNQLYLVELISSSDDDEGGRHLDHATTVIYDSLRDSHIGLRNLGFDADLTPLDEVTRGDNELTAALNRIPAGIRRLAERDGHLWAWPYSIELSVMGVRVDLFHNAGLDVNPNWDWDDFLTDAEKTNALIYVPNQHPRFFGAVLSNMGSVIPFWHAFFLGASDRLIATDGTSHFTDPANVLALETIRHWFDTGAIGEYEKRPNANEEVFNNPGTALKQGIAAMQPIHSHYLLTGQSPLRKRLPPDSLIGLPMPHAPGHAPAPVPADVFGWVIPNHTPAQVAQAALRFAAWAGGERPDTFAFSGMLPAEPALGLEAYGPTARTYYGEMAEARVWNEEESSNGPWSRFVSHWHDFITGRLTPEAYAQLIDFGAPPVN